MRFTNLLLFTTCLDYTEGIDYFQAEQMLEFAQVHILSRESKEDDVESAGLDALDGKASSHKNSGAEEEEKARIKHKQNSPPRIRSSNSSKRRRPATNATSANFERADTMRFAELWEELKRVGWTSVYGSGLVERYYLCPGVNKHSGTPPSPE